LSREVSLRSLRRDRVLIWLWLPFGGLAIVLVAQLWRLVAGEPPPRLYTALDVVWMVVTFGLIWRNSSRRCPQCAHRWLRGFPWMSLKRVDCGACGHPLK
jgi:hypothetical protein